MTRGLMLLVAVAVLAVSALAAQAANDGVSCSITAPDGTQACDASCSAGEHAFCWGVYAPEAGETSAECACVKLPGEDFRIVIEQEEGDGEDGHGHDHDEGEGEDEGDGEDDHGHDHDEGKGDGGD